MIIQKAEILTVELPMKRHFKVSFGTIMRRKILILKLHTESLTGYGECSALHFPGYLPDFTDAEKIVIKDFILPSILKRRLNDIDELTGQMSFIKGHNFAKSAVECAFWHLLSQKENKSLKKLFGGNRKKIDVGESIDIKKSIDETLREVDLKNNEGFKRIKIKIKKGWDLKLIDAIRKQFPKINLMVDANSGYDLKDLNTFKKLDRYRLMMIEQPLQYNDLVDHAKLQKKIKTPICLDESICNLEDAKKALELGSCKTINIKPPRVGGPRETIKIHNFCKKNRMPVWCGGLMESGIGRAFNIALASLPNFRLPADMSEYSDFYEEDLVKDPYKIINGQISVPETTGLGFKINDAAIKKYTTEKITITL